MPPREAIPTLVQVLIQVQSTSTNHFQTLTVRAPFRFHADTVQNTGRRGQSIRTWPVNQEKPRAFTVFLTLFQPSL